MTLEFPPMTIDRIDKTIVGAFIDAAVKDPPKARQLLQEHPRLREARWIHHETTLHFLAVEGYAEAVTLLGGFGFDANLPNEFGDPPLIDVATLANDEVAAVLLGCGADPNGRSDTRDNVLHCAVRSGNVRLVQLLLAAGAKSDYITPLGETVFDALPEDGVQRTAVAMVLQHHGVKRAP
jgi:ankyrin repeat protein